MTHISAAVIAKMGRREAVNIETLAKICIVLECKLSDLVDIVPKSERFYLTLSYNHRRRAEMNLSDQRSMAGFAVGAGVRIYKFRLGFAMSQMTRNNFSYQVGLSLDINSMLK